MNEFDKAMASTVPEPKNPIEFYIRGTIEEIAADLQTNNESYIEYGSECGLHYEDSVLCAKRIAKICESRGWTVYVDINSVNNRYRWVKIWIKA